MAEAVLGIIGGSGLYELPGLVDARWEEVASPWGEPSDALRIGRFAGLKLVFLPRHGRGHYIRTEDVKPLDLSVLEGEHGRT